MNIFVLDNDPQKAAQYHVDKHVVKMCLETAQLLCDTFYTNSKIRPPYKVANVLHPCSRWAAHSVENYSWLGQLGIELCAEYHYRYNKIHKSYYIINWCKINLNKLEFKHKGMTKQPLCMPELYHCDDVVEAYRAYYRNEKNHLAKWTNRNVPEWY